MYVVLFLIYFFLLCLLITRMSFLSSSNIKPKFLLLFFGIHVITACVHNWIAYQSYPNHGDIWFFFNESLDLKQELLVHPAKFFSDFISDSKFNFTSNNLPRFGFQYVFMKHINLFLNFFSFNNFYINSLLFSFISFCGAIALFKTFNAFFFKNSILCALCTLLLPSTLFWTSCIHKDGLLYLAIGFFYYYIYQLFISHGNIKKYLLCILFSGIIFLARANVAITLIPAILFWVLNEKKYSKKSFLIGVPVVFVVCVLILTVNPGIYTGILKSVSDRQKEYYELKGNSKIYLPVLEPTTGSFLSVLPFAFINGFFQPLPGFGGNNFYLAFAFELLIIWVTISFAVYLLVKKYLRLSNFDYLCLIFSLPAMLMIGYTIPFAGAIVRYRSIYLPFLLAPFINVLVSYRVYFIKKTDDWLKEIIMIKN
jgi:hypothetical protein